MQPRGPREQRFGASVGLEVVEAAAAGTRVVGTGATAVVAARGRATQVVAAGVDGAERGGQQLGELGELAVDVGVAVAALLVGLGVRLVDDARRLAVRGRR